MISLFSDLCKFFIFSVLLFTPLISAAVEDTEKLSQKQRKEITPTTLPTVTVKASRLAPLTGATIIDQEMIKILPSKNGSINELISIVPGVQFGEGMSNSSTAGEITPPNISISGSHFYENNFTIDGINNNSSIEPANGEIFTTSILTGHPQKIILDPHLIEKIIVYDSNISAEHGGFTGGQVEASTHDPVDEFWGNVNYVQHETLGLNSTLILTTWMTSTIPPLQTINHTSTSTMLEQPSTSRLEMTWVF